MRRAERKSFSRYLVRKISQAEFSPAAQARAKASSSTRRLRKKLRASASDEAPHLVPTSQRIVEKDSRVRPIRSQPALAWSSARISFTTDCTAELGFDELMAHLRI